MISHQYAHQILSDIAENCYLSLHLDSPILAGAYASEISGSGYARRKLEFAQPSSRSVVNVNDVRFSGLPQTRVTWVGGWNAAINGDILWYVELATPVIIPQGSGYGIGAGEVIISI